MGVFARTRKSGTVYYVSFIHDGKLVQERAGTDKRAAQALERQRKREVRDGTYSRNQPCARPTLAQYTERWLARRRNRTVDDDKARLELHVLPALGKIELDEIRPRHVRELVESLCAANEIAPKTIRNVYGVLRTLFRDAVIDEIILANPCVLPKGTLPAVAREEKTIYSREELETLLSSPKIPQDRRTLYALAGLTGMRHGEAAGRRWRHYDREARPLGCLEVGTQYEDLPLKTSNEKQRPRRVPVHPLLAGSLGAWHAEGFAVYFGRAPAPEDFIIPSRRGPRRHRVCRSSLTKLIQDCERTGIRPLTFHRLRDTFISLARRGGARKDVLERITHNASGDIIDRYTSFDWEPLCEAVSCLKVGEPRARYTRRSHDAQHDARRARPDLLKAFSKFRSGEGGIRTRGTLTGTHDFQSCTFGLSVTSPWLASAVGLAGHSS
jgi:integrase